MGIIIQKYGGSSVADLERMRCVALIVKQARSVGHFPVVVISAQKGVTDQLLEKAHTLTPFPSLSALDRILVTGESEAVSLFSLALEAEGIAARPFSGIEAGILTNNRHTQARILDIQCQFITQAIAAGEVPVVAGFQGATKEGALTTLGRGGSDLTALALAAALKAEACEIYTDVPGIFTADPAIVPSANFLQAISFETLAQLSTLGARVMQARSVTFAQRAGVAFVVRSSFEDTPGSLVSRSAPAVNAIALDTQRMGVQVAGLASFYIGQWMRVLAQKGIAADGFQYHNTGLAFNIQGDEVWKVGTLLEQGGFKEATLNLLGPVARLSWVGAGVAKGQSFFQKTMSPFQPQGIVACGKRISAFLPLEAMVEASCALHHALGLDCAKFFNAGMFSVKKTAAE